MKEYRSFNAIGDDEADPELGQSIADVSSDTNSMDSHIARAGDFLEKAYSTADHSKVQRIGPTVVVSVPPGHGKTVNAAGRLFRNLQTQLTNHQSIGSTFFSTASLDNINHLNNEIRMYRQQDQIRDREDKIRELEIKLKARDHEIAKFRTDNWNLQSLIMEQCQAMEDMRSNLTYESKYQVLSEQHRNLEAQLECDLKDLRARMQIIESRCAQDVAYLVDRLCAERRSAQEVEERVRKEYKRGFQAAQQIHDRDIREYGQAGKRQGAQATPVDHSVNLRQAQERGWWQADRGFPEHLAKLWPSLI